MPEEVAGLVVNIEANAKEAITQLKDIEQRLQHVHKQRYAVQINARESIGKVEQLITSLRELKRSSKINIDITDGGASTKVSNINKSLSSLERRRQKYDFTFTTNADTVAGKVEKLSVALKEVTNAKRALNYSTNADMVARQVQMLRREVQSLHSISKRPINANVSGLTKGYEQVTRATREATNAQKMFQYNIRQTRSLWVTFRDSLTIFGTGYLAISALNQVLGFMRSSMIDFNDTLQQAHIGFSTILGDAEKASHLVDVVKQFAIDTPFSMQGVMPDVQKLLSFGVIDKNLPIGELSKQVVESMTAIGDASYALGRGQEGISRMLLAFGQMHTATKANAQDLRQLKEVGVDAWRYLAEGTGKTTAEVRELVSKGLIPAEAAIRAIIKGMARDFGGGMARAATESISGAFEVFTDTLQSKIAAGYDAVNKHFTGLFTKLADTLDSKNVSDWADKAAAAVEGVLLRALDKGTAAITAFSDAITKNKVIVEGYLAMLAARSLAAMSMSGNATGIATMAVGLSLLSDNSTKAGRAAQTATPLVWALAIAVQGLNTAIALNNTLFGTSKMMGIIPTIGKIIGSVRTLASEFMALSRALGAMSALRFFLASFTSSAMATGGLYALPALTAVILTAATAWQKYQEKLAVVKAVQAELNYVSKATVDSLKDLEKYAGADTGVTEKIRKLATEYQKLHTSIEGIKELQGQIGDLRQEIKVSAKFDEVDRNVLNDVLDKYQKLLDEENSKLKLKAQLEVDVNPMSWKNIKEAWIQQYGFLTESIKWVGKVLFDALFANPYRAVTAIWMRIANFFKSFNERVRSVARGMGNALKDAFIRATGGAEGWGARVINIIVRINDAINILRQNIVNAFMGALSRFHKWATGSSADGQGLVPGIGDPITKVPGRRRMPSDFMVSHKSLDRDYSVADSRAAVRDAESKKTPHIPITGGAGGRGGGAKREAADNRAAQAAARLKKQLEDSAQAYEALAKSAEDSAAKQIKALQGIVDSLRGVFEGVQKKLIDMGIIDNPLGNLISQFQNSMGFDKKVNEIGARHGAQIAGYESKAAALRGRAETVGVVSGDKFGTSLANEMAASVHRSVGIKMACARFVTNWIKQLGIAVKGSDSAAQLRANVIRSGARRIPVSQARAGDVLFMRSKSAPSGYHTGIGAGGGMFAAKNRNRYGKIATYGWQEAYATSELAGGGSPIYAPSGDAGGGRSMLDSLRNTISEFSSALSTLSAVPKGWGKSVRDEKGGMMRFATQTYLTTAEGQAFLREMVGKELVTPSLTKDPGKRVKIKSIDDAAAFLRDVANKADVVVDKATYPERIRAVAEETAKYNKTQADSIDMLRLSMQIMDKEGVSLSKRTRELAIAAEAQKIWNELMNTPGLTHARRQIELNSRMRAFKKEYDLKEITETRDKNLNAIEELDKAYRELSDATVEATLKREIYGQKGALLFPQIELEIRLTKALRNERKKAQDSMLKGLMGENTQMWLDFVNRDASAADQLKNKYEQALLDVRKTFPSFTLTPDIVDQQAANIELAKAEEKYDKLSESIKNVQSQIEGLNGVASAEEISKLGFKANDLNEQFHKMLGVVPLTTAQVTRFQEEIAKTREQVGELTVDMSDFNKEWTRLSKMRTRASKGLGLQQEVYDYREQLLSQKKDNKPVYTSSEIDRLTQEFASIRSDEERANYQQDLGTRLLQRSMLTDFSAQAAVLKKQFIQNGFTEDEISTFLGREKWIYAFDMLKGVFSTAFDSIYTEGFGGFFRNISNGISKMLNDIATQILTSYVTNMIMGLVGFGGGMPLMGAGGGSFLQPLLGLPGFASGLPYVPRDNYVARLHKGEAVLTAQEAEMWRNMSTGVVSGGGKGAQGGGTVVNNYYNIGSVQANNPQQFVKRMDGAKKSRSQSKRDAMVYVSGGQESL